MLFEALAGQRRQGRTVTAGKILYGKRPSLVPLYDSYIRQRYGVTNNNVWEIYWCFLQDARIRRQLGGAEVVRDGGKRAVTYSDRRHPRLDVLTWRLPLVNSTCPPGIGTRAISNHSPLQFPPPGGSRGSRRLSEDK